jgi:hypothetical protein
MPVVDRVSCGLAALLLATMAALQVSSVVQESQTYDEAVYISAGYSYWKTGDFRLNPEHPPLAKLLVSAPLLFIGVTLPLRDPAWQKADQYAFGAQFLYHNRISADAILLRARCVTIVLTVLFGLTVFFWVKRRAGPVAALVALGLFTFDPNLLAHGRYATNDLALAFFFFAGVALWNRALRRGELADYAVAGVAIGAAIATKLSGVAVIPVAVLFCFGRPLNAGTLARGALVAGAAALAFVALLYHGQLHYYRDVVTDSLGHASGGQLAYLFGSTFRRGRWYFYPAVFAVKTPVGVLLLVAVVAAAIVVRRSLARGSHVVLIAGAVYGAACLASPIDLGVRILLPVYVCLYVVLALNLPSSRWRWPAVVALAAVVAESAMIYPNYLAFFNVIAGGPARGPRYLLDSNIDWGQDTKRLAAFLRANRIPNACTAYFGMAYPFYYGIVQRPWVGYVNARNRESLNCVLAVSVTWLYGGPAIAGDTWGWLRAQRPDARVGYSIYVYDFRNHPTLNR